MGARHPTVPGSPRGGRSNLALLLLFSLAAAAPGRLTAAAGAWEAFFPVDGEALAAGGSPPELAFVPVEPCPLVDTRIAGGAFADGEVRIFAVRGETTDYGPQGGSGSGCGVPGAPVTPAPGDARAVLLHFEVLGAARDGKLTAWAADRPQPPLALLSYLQAPLSPGVPTLGTSGVAIVPLCDDPGAAPCAAGDIRVVLGGAAHLAVAVHGYLRSGGALPAGLITMWSGAVADIPPGWALCDGSNGTPDLADRFVLGVAAGEDPGATGGSNSLTLSVDQLPRHSHVLEIDRARFHTHTYLRPVGRSYAGNLIGGPDSLRWDLRGVETATTSEEELRHDHDATLFPAGGDQPFDNRPAFYELAFIMKL